MQFPYTLTVSGQDISVHALCEFVAVFAAYRYFVFLKKRTGDVVSQNSRLSVVIGATIGAVLGSRLLGAAEDIPAWMRASSSWQYFFYNKTMVGGLLGGLAGVELIKKIIGEREHTGDLFVFPLIMGIIIGRLGCFSAGIYEEAYGIPAHLPWAMNLGDGIPRHPVALYEIVFLMLLTVFLMLLKKKYPLQQGALFKLFIIAYLVFRLQLDVIKPGWRYLFGLGSIQLACIAGLLYYARYLVRPGLLLKNN